jgi:hypothetical protein
MHERSRCGAGRCLRTHCSANSSAGCLQPGARQQLAVHGEFLRGRQPLQEGQLGDRHRVDGREDGAGLCRHHLAGTGVGRVGHELAAQGLALHALGDVATLEAIVHVEDGEHRGCGHAVRTRRDHHACVFGGAELGRDRAGGCRRHRGGRCRCLLQDHRAQSASRHEVERPGRLGRAASEPAQALDTAVQACVALQGGGEAAADVVCGVHVRSSGRQPARTGRVTGA